MRIKLTFTSENDIILPISYHELLQGLIYNYIDNKLADFLHDYGFVTGGRHFKLFTFSRIQGRVRFLKDIKAFQIASPFSFVVSSPVENFIQSLAENVVKSEMITLQNQQIFLESINVYFMPRPTSETVIVMLSPMTMYSTFIKPDGKKVTHPWRPFEKEFSRLLSENLKKKYKLIYNKEPDSLAISIRPVKVGRNSEKIVRYKDTVIHGWMGEYKITGSPELISVAYDTGLGSKNPQGFGCFEIIPTA